MSTTGVMITGLLVSFLMLELAGVYPGGIIVPGFLALYVRSPVRILATFLVALGVILVYRLLSRRALIFGRRKFIFMIITGAVLAAGCNAFLPGFTALSLDSRIIGLMIPGLIANNADNQGIVRTCSAAAAAVAATYFISQIFTVLTAAGPGMGA